MSASESGPANVEQGTTVTQWAIRVMAVWTLCGYVLWSQIQASTAGVTQAHWWTRGVLVGVAVSISVFIVYRVSVDE